MCQSVTIPHLDFYAGNVQQLANRLGVHPRDLVWEENSIGGEPIDGNYRYCLCPIDLEKTAQKFGFACERPNPVLGRRDNELG